MSDIGCRSLKPMDFFHVLNRGVDKRQIFMDDQDRARFIHDLFEFNDVFNVKNVLRRLDATMSDIGCCSSEKKPRKLLVNIHAFCMMDNHYHLLLSSLAENGVSKFMKKLNMGYAKYFNQKYERSGALFQGRYKKITVENDAHFIHLPYYIHFNPLDFKFYEWRDGKLKDYKKAVQFLDSYRWSSHLDYCGKKNFPSVTQRETLSKFFKESGGYVKNITDWLRNLNCDKKDSVFLE